MKTTIAVLAAFLSLPSAFAAQPSAELQRVARALVNNADIVAKLKANYSDHLSDLTITSLSRTETRYELVFIRQCECIPSTAHVSILEDTKPTEVDGPIRYTSSIRIEEGR